MAATGLSRSSIPRRTLARQYVSGLRVFSPDRLVGLVQSFEVEEVLLAMPKAQRRERQAALRQLEQLKVRVRTLPAIEDVAAGRVTVSDLRPVEADDLLGRDPVPPDTSLLARNIVGKSVMVTGAGGSIGSELVRQIIRNNPKRLVLLERSESHLYEIDLEVQTLLQSAPSAALRPSGRRWFACWGRSSMARWCARPSSRTASKPSITPPPSSTCRWWSTILSPACATIPSAPPCLPMLRLPAAWNGSC